MFSEEECELVILEAKNHNKNLWLWWGYDEWREEPKKKDNSKWN